MDICIQIGNSDNKLTQQEWSKYCQAVLSICEGCGNVHFSGGSNTDAPWQNYCVVVHVDFEKIKTLKDLITKRRIAYSQDSVAWIEGIAEYV
jgi:hypothetical protein